MFRAALFTTAKWQKQPKCPETGKWKSRVWYSHTMEYHTSLKLKEILTHATTWMNSEGIVLSEISPKKTKDIRPPLTASTAQRQR